MTPLSRRAWLASVLLLLLLTGCSRACGRLGAEEEAHGCDRCAKDQYCTREDRCAPLGKLGEPCEMAEHCVDPGALCRSGKCALRPKMGEACEGTGECDDGVCRAGTCSPRAKLGEACELPSDCADRDALCKASRCTARPEAGGACADEGECVAGTYCGPDGKCRAFADRGKPCAEVRCKEGLACLAAGGAGPPICHPSAAIGEACVRARAPDGIPHDNCATGFCQGDGAKGTCVASRASGEPCEGSWQCEKGFVCKDARCERTSGGPGWSPPHPF